MKLAHHFETSDFASKMFLGRVFHNQGAVTLKDLLPIQLHPTCATMSKELFNDLVTGPATGLNLQMMKSVTHIAYFEFDMFPYG